MDKRVLPTYEVAHLILRTHIVVQSPRERELQAAAFLSCAHDSLRAARRATDPEHRSYLAFRARCHVRMARYWMRAHAAY